MKTLTEKISRNAKPSASAFRFCLLFLLSAIIQLFTCLSFADTSTTNMLVSAEVKSTCVINANSVQFGVYDPTGVNQSSSLNVGSDINLKCVRGTAAQVSIDNGTHYGKASGSSRAMANADSNAFLAYELYKDKSGTQTWDSGTKVEKYADTSTDVNVTFYAKIPANQSVPDGAYSDTLTVTVIY